MKEGTETRGQICALPWEQGPWHHGSLTAKLMGFMWIGEGSVCEGKRPLPF